MVIAFWLSWALASLCAAGQGTPIPERALAAKLEHYRRISDLRVTFRQVKWMKEMGIRLDSQGELALHRPDQVTWRISRPSPLLVRLGGGHIHIETGSGADRTVQDFPMANLPSDRGARALAGLVAWLRLDAHAIAAQYQVVELGPRSFRFSPRPGVECAFAGLELELSREGNLKRLAIDELSQDRLEIEFGKPILEK